MPVRLPIVLLATLALAAPAEAARTVDRGFYGLSYDGELRSAAADVQARAWGQMAANGAESGRTVFSWAAAQPAEGAAFDFGVTDQFVEDAVEHWVHLLPVVMETPAWARERPGNWWPRRAADYGAYVRAVVLRYGPEGTFWTEHPAVPRRPIRHWQILNEPGRSKRFGPLLRAAHRAVKRADPGAKVVLAGLTGTDHGGTPWDVLRWQYRHGKIRGRFDVAAIHMYTQKPANVVEGARLFRRVMARAGDGRKPLWMTEFGITASKGRTEAPDSQRTLRTTDRGMARFLHEAYRLLARNNRRGVRVGRAYWYTWASSYQSGQPIFRFTGLYRYADGRFDAKPALAQYRASARRDEGCRKTTTARCR